MRGSGSGNRTSPPTIATTKQWIEEKVQAVVRNGYGIKQLGDIADIKSGGTPSRKNNA